LCGRGEFVCGGCASSSSSSSSLSILFILSVFAPLFCCTTTTTPLNNDLPTYNTDARLWSHATRHTRCCCWGYEWVSCRWYSGVWARGPGRGPACGALRGRPWVVAAPRSWPPPAPLPRPRHATQTG
jgi:hypothetical protein